MVTNGCHKDEWWYIEQYELCRSVGNSIVSCIEFHCSSLLHGSVDFKESMSSNRVTKLLLINIVFITSGKMFFLGYFKSPYTNSLWNSWTQTR